MDERGPEHDSGGGCRQGDDVAEPLALLARGLAHDFNNLLLVMMLYADLIGRRQGHGCENGEASVEVREVRRAVERGRKLTRQLQTYAGNDPVQPEPLDCGEVLGDLAPELQQVMGDGIVLDIRMPRSKLRPVVADRARLEEAILVLAGEARSRMRSGGIFTIEAENGSVADGGPVPPGNCILFHLADDGENVPDEHLTRIFEPYYALKQLGKGSGLGLAVCQSIAHRAAGHLEAQRRTGGGMRFTLCLPAGPVC
ncbi:sensor histidine kinase [Breoghania corrubedonensis]|nr:ATP-binding protein [Breoghania corrubedonensis]